MYNARYKVIIFGDTTSGKTMFVEKYLTNLYRSDQTMTIGVDFEVRSVSVNGLKLLLYRYEHYKKDLESFLEKIKQWDDYNEDKYPYSDILKLFSGDNEYRERILTKIGRWRD